MTAMDGLRAVKRPAGCKLFAAVSKVACRFVLQAGWPAGHFGGFFFNSYIYIITIIIYNLYIIIYLYLYMCISGFLFLQILCNVYKILPPYIYICML